MNASLRSRLDAALVRLDEVNGLLASEDATRNMEQFRKLSREHSDIATLAQLYERFQQAERDSLAAKEMAGDPSMKVFADEELKAAREEMEQVDRELQKQLLPKDANDERNLFLEIRAGTGGDESGLFAGDLLRMYTR